MYFCNTGGINGRGLYTPEGFVVLSGSTGTKDTKPALIGHAYEEMRKKLIESGVVQQQEQQIVFLKDHLFNKPSPAAVALLGRPANGWLEWKTQDGRTLDSIERQEPAAQG